MKLNWRLEAQNMTPITLLFLVFPLLMTTHILQASWVQTTHHTQLPITSHNLTNLHFYFHDITGGRDRSIAVIAKPDSASYGFGTLVMIDDPLTVAPDRRSKLIGRAQGMYAIASQTEPILLMTLTFSFLEGSYNGSSISILGRYNVADEEREMPIIGGSGLFKLARGYAVAKRYKSSTVKDEDTAEFNVFVVHGDASSML